MKERRNAHHWPSKLTLARNKGEIELEGNTKFPTELADEQTNAGDKRRPQIKPKENMDKVGERLCARVNETMVRQTGNGHTSVASELSR